MSRHKSASNPGRLNVPPKEDFAACEKRERDRERYWRNETEQGRFESSFRHIDHCHFEAMEESPSWLSDNGAGVETIIDAVDSKTRKTRYGRLLRKARDHVRNKAPHLLEELNLIIKNGSNREESIWEMMKS